MDICMYISDQHAFNVQGYAGNKLVRTPNLDRIAKEGTAFMNAYTPYPVCVPARMSMLTGLSASHCGVMSNNTSLDSNIPTFLHCLNASGYETVLCGRMHFVGGDQRHGFSKRIAGDITQIYQNRPKRIEIERGAHNKTPQGGPSSVSLVGAGNSPTLEYDRYVVSTAKEYLSQNYQKPQFFCVGTYGPHHPFVAPKELFDYYYDKVEVNIESLYYDEHPALKNDFKDKDVELIRAVEASYYGMVEFEDQKIGEVYDAFNDYLKRNQREGIFIYVSDHGEMRGYRGYFGKNTFYESSVHIPMIIQGANIKKNQKKNGAVSLLDIGPTILDLTDSISLPHSDGKSLKQQCLSDFDEINRTVFSEVGGNITMNRFSYGQMAVCNMMKYIHYDGYEDVLYDLTNDSNESVSIENEWLDLLKNQCQNYFDVPVQQIKKNAYQQKENETILRKCTLDSEELWHCPASAREVPNPCYRSKINVEDWINQLKNKESITTENSQ